MKKSSPITIAVTVYQLLIWLAVHLQSVFLLAIRLIWGWQFFQTGMGKLAHPDKVGRLLSEPGHSSS